MIAIYVHRGGGGGGGGVWGREKTPPPPPPPPPALACQNPQPIIVYSVAKYRPHFCHFWENVIFAILT